MRHPWLAAVGLCWLGCSQTETFEPPSVAWVTGTATERQQRMPEGKVVLTAASGRLLGRTQLNDQGFFTLGFDANHVGSDWLKVEVIEPG